MGITPNRRSILKGAASFALGTTLPFTSSKASNHNTIERGFNLPAWAGQIDSRPPAKPTLETLSHLGFTTVRLPIHPANLLGENARASLKHIEEAVSLLHATGFSVTVDMHLEQEFIAAFEQNASEAADNVAAAWAYLTPVLANLPATTTYAELLNEPPLDNPAWLSLRDRLAGIVRTACPNHTIIWGAARHQGIWETVDHPPLTDANSWAAVHYYWPFGFTHQCASWGDPAMEKLRELPFPTTKASPEVTGLRQSLMAQNDQAALKLLDEAFGVDWSYSIIEEDFAKLAAWSHSNSTPVIVNEFGVLDFCVDRQSRQNWISHVRRTAEKHGMSWTYWELDHGFGFMGDRQDPESVDFATLTSLVAG